MKARTLTPKEEMRLFAGLAIQPFLAAAVSALTYPVIFAERLAQTSAPVQAIVAVALHVGVAALLVIVICVVPTTVWVVKRIRVSVVQSLAWGVAFANLPIALITIAAGRNPFWLNQHALVTVIGLAGAAAFWTIAIRGRDLSRDPVN